MHPKFSIAPQLTHAMIGSAIEVHKEFGPGLLESVYEWCLVKDLELKQLSVKSQEFVSVHWKDFTKQYPLKFDMLVNDCLLLEIKAADSVLPIHKAQLLSYMKLLDVPLGLIINFNELKLVDGISRLILPGAHIE